MMSTTKHITKVIGAAATAMLLVLTTLFATTPAYAADFAANEGAADATATEVLPVYQAVSANEAAAGAEVLPAFAGAAQVTSATGVQPMGVEGAPLMRAVDEFSGWVIPFAAVASVMLIALGVFGIKMARTSK